MAAAKGKRRVELRARWVVKTTDGDVKPGETFETDADEARRLVGRGVAEYVDKQAPAPKPPDG